MHTWRTIIAGFIEVMMSHMVKNRGHTHLELNRLCPVFYLVKFMSISVFFGETKTLLNNRPNRHQRLFQISETFLNQHSRLFLWNVVSNDQSAALNVKFTLKCGSNAVTYFRFVHFIFIEDDFGTPLVRTCDDQISQHAFCINQQQWWRTRANTDV